MKISVVTITYNDKSGLEKTIDSVNGQSARDLIEYIVIDGASTDGTETVLVASGKKIDVLVSERDRGIYDAMNKGLARASGDYIIFMNSGDVFSASNVVERIVREIENEGRCPAVVYGTYREAKEGVCGNAIPCRRPKRIWYGPVASHQSTFYHLPTLRHLNLMYDTDYRIAADYKLTLSVMHATNNDGKATDICVSDFDITGASNANQDCGLNEANRARREVLGWSRIRCFGMKCLLLSARYTKKYMRPVYNLLRNR